MRAKKKHPEIGDRLRIWWWDYTGHVNSPLAEAKPAKCWSEGQLVKDQKHYMVLASSLFTNEKGEQDGGELTGDFTVVIKGGIESIEHL